MGAKARAVECVVVEESCRCGTKRSVAHATFRGMRLSGAHFAKLACGHDVVRTFGGFISTKRVPTCAACRRAVARRRT